MKLLYYLSIALLITGCTDDAHVKALEQKLEVANTEISNFKIELNQLKATTQAVKIGMDKIGVDLFLKDLNDKYAYLTPGTDGYAVIRYDLGAITVRIADIRPYANGSMVTLEFGNPLSAAVDGLKATLDWGKVDDKGSPINDQQKTREITFNDTLYGGKWTRVPIVLDGVPPGEFGFLSLRGVSHNGIKLLR